MSTLLLQFFFALLITSTVKAALVSAAWSEWVEVRNEIFRSSGDIQIFQAISHNNEKENMWQKIRFDIRSAHVHSQES